MKMGALHETQLRKTALFLLNETQLRVQKRQCVRYPYHLVKNSYRVLRLFCSLSQIDVFVRSRQPVNVSCADVKASVVSASDGTHTDRPQSIY